MKLTNPAERSEDVSLLAAWEEEENEEGRGWF